MSEQADRREIVPVVHVAGLVINLGGHLRQRCAWCGALLDDVELALTAGLIEHADQPYPTWPEGCLVAVDGGAKWTRAVRSAARRTLRSPRSGGDHVTGTSLNRSGRP